MRACWTLAVLLIFTFGLVVVPQTAVAEEAGAPAGADSPPLDAAEAATRVAPPAPAEHGGR